MGVSLQQLIDSGINGFAVKCFYESWNTHPTSPRKALAFPFADCVITIQEAEEFRQGPEKRVAQIQLLLNDERASSERKDGRIRELEKRVEDLNTRNKELMTKIKGWDETGVKT